MSHKREEEERGGGGGEGEGEGEEEEGEGGEEASDGSVCVEEGPAVTLYLGPSDLGLRIPGGLAGQDGVRAQRHLLGLRQRGDLGQGWEGETSRDTPLDDTREIKI